MSIDRPLHVLILAGGSGTRFWPWSRTDLPKQFLALDGSATLLEQTLRRLDGWVPPEQRWILTRADLVETVHSQVPDFASDRIVGEPEGRDTAPALAFGALRVAALASDSDLLVLPSDHHIDDPQAFAATVARARQALTDDDGLYTFGVTPTEPATGYGYIERDTPTSPGCFSVRAFREKPDRETAEQFLRGGEHFWNAGIFLWRTQTFLEELVRCGEGFARPIETLRGAIASETGVDDAFRTLPKISIDYALLERSDRVRVVEATFPWDDVGTWEAVARLRADRRDLDGNIGEEGAAFLDSSGSVVVRPAGAGEKTIALFGGENLLVVETEDALLVCPRDRAQEVKQVVDHLRGTEAEKTL